jgi:drug/metabolite transporter (DMT)-like permease
VRAGTLAALGATIAWGCNYTFAKRVLDEIHPLSAASARALTGVLVFGAVLLIMDGPAGLSPARFRRTAFLGLLRITANQILFIEGLSRTTPSHSAILIALLPVHVLVLSTLAGQERITRRKWLGVAIAFAGVVVVATEKGLSPAAGTLKGDLLTLCGGLAFAGYTVAGRPVLRDLGPLRTTALSFLAGGAMILVITMPTALRETWSAVSPTAFLGLAYMLLIGTVAAYLLWYFALAHLDPSKVAVFTYLQPLIAAAVAYAVRGESITTGLLAGAALILAGVVIAERG